VRELQALPVQESLRQAPLVQEPQQEDELRPPPAAAAYHRQSRDGHHQAGPDAPPHPEVGAMRSRDPCGVQDSQSQELDAPAA